MAEYIERETVNEVVKHAWAKGLEPTQYIDIIPAADVAPVVHGKWISRMFGTHECSNCHKDPIHYDGITGYVEILSDFCPNCGAKMSLED